MTKRIFRSICLAVMAVLAASLCIIMGALYGYFARVQQNQLRTQTALAARAVEEEGIGYLENLPDLECRLTWIDSGGNVLFDSEEPSDQMENHLQREEIRKALKTGFGESVRYSSTLMEQYVYCAQRLSDGTVLRLSVARHSAATLLLGMARSVCVVILVAVVLSLWLAQRLSESIVRPLNELNLDAPLSQDGYEELKPLLSRIDSQQRQLQGRDTQLRRKQREFDTVTNNMNEGLVLMNESCNVLTMNPAAARIMGLVRPFIGVNFRTLNGAQTMEAALNAALNGTHGECSAALSGGVYQIDASPVRAADKVSGVALLMFDITQKQYLETQRREFTANVSHELKTPLHTISGYAELMKNGMVSPGDIPGFSGKIYDEAQRMIRLIEDILKLSSLDEGAADMTRERTDLYALAAETVKALTPMAQENQIRLYLKGESHFIEGIPQLLSGIITNLLTNAIKYNNPGGKAWVEVGGDDTGVTLTVSDTGIGISPEHQKRIFERFYRVDKSRSKAVGGTGLGLSIVKHAAMIHNAKIELNSTPGLGTTIRIRFPIEKA